MAFIADKNFNFYMKKCKSIVFRTSINPSKLYNMIYHFFPENISLTFQDQSVVNCIIHCATLTMVQTVSCSYINLIDKVQIRDLICYCYFSSFVIKNTNYAFLTFHFSKKKEKKLFMFSLLKK